MITRSNLNAIIIQRQKYGICIVYECYESIQYNESWYYSSNGLMIEMCNTGVF